MCVFVCVWQMSLPAVSGPRRCTTQLIKAAAQGAAGQFSAWGVYLLLATFLACAVFSVRRGVHGMCCGVVRFDVMSCDLVWVAH